MNVCYAYGIIIIIFRVFPSFVIYIYTYIVAAALDNSPKKSHARHTCRDKKRIIYLYISSYRRDFVGRAAVGRLRPCSFYYTIFVAHNALGICWGARKDGVKKKQEQFEFTFENVLAKLNMVIWVSLRFFFSFLLALPVFTAHLQRGERIKRAYQRFFFFIFISFVLIYATRRHTNVLYALCDGRLADSPSQRTPRIKSPGHIFRDYFTAKIRDGGNAHTCTEKPYRVERVRYEIGYDGCQNNVRFLYFFAGATCFRPDYAFSGRGI